MSRSRSSDIVRNLHIDGMDLEQITQSRPVNHARLEQLPRALAPTRATGLQGESHEVLGPNHSYRDALVVMRSCGANGVGHQCIVGGQDLHWYVMHHQVFALESETLALRPPIDISEGCE